MAKETPLPEHRASRLLKLGLLVGRMAGETLREGATTLVAGKPIRPTDLLLTPANARHLTNRLSEMRGAVMKVGQLLSMEAGDYLPSELSQILDTLFESARPMPRRQVSQVLESAWGSDWQAEFEHFSFTPLAAASIGQVHEAITRDGRHLAVKIQYPGVRNSIDSDIDNVSVLFKLIRLIPRDYDIAPLLQEAKHQLHLETDYCAEAASIAEYDRFLDDDSGFELPKVDLARTTPEVLAMSFVPGVAIETLADDPRQIRDQVATRLLALVLKEVFEWGLVQTDANFGNYRYQTETDRIGLLDFGAMRHYKLDFVNLLRLMLGAARAANVSAIEDYAVELGYLRAEEAAPYRQGLCEMISTVAEPIRCQGAFDFGTSDLSQRIADQAIALRFHQRYMHLPPTDVLFLHRKFAGTYLLCARLGAQVDVSKLVAPYLE